MTPIYFIPGLGADKRLYAKQSQLGIEFQVLEWIEPETDESFSSYALRFSDLIKEKNNFILIGVSLGGILAQEIARILPPQKLIIISSVKCRKEIPFYIRLLKYVPIHKLFSGRLLREMGRVARKIIGGTNKNEAEELNNMILSASPVFIEWAVDKVINWQCEIPLPGIIHLHGTRDIMFPRFFLRNVQLVKGGSHIMIYNKANVLNELLIKELCIPVS